MKLKTKTDEEGRFRLAGMPKGKGNKIIIVPNDEQPYFMQEVEFPDPPGAGPVSRRGRLAARRSGSRASSPKRRPESQWQGPGSITFRSSPTSLPSSTRPSTATATPTAWDFSIAISRRADGTFRLVGLPGRAIVGAVVDKAKYLQGAGSEAIEGMNAAGHFETYQQPESPRKALSHRDEGDQPTRGCRDRASWTSRWRPARRCVCEWSIPKGIRSRA